MMCWDCHMSGNLLDSIQSPVSERHRMIFQVWPPPPQKKRSSSPMKPKMLQVSTTFWCSPAPLFPLKTFPAKLPKLKSRMPATCTWAWTNLEPQRPASKYWSSKQHLLLASRRGPPPTTVAAPQASPAATSTTSPAPLAAAPAQPLPPITDSSLWCKDETPNPVAHNACHGTHFNVNASVVAPKP